MNKKQITKAKKEAEEFIKRAREVLADPESLAFVEIGCGNRDSGALRRQSMELTRALSDLRS